MGPHGSGETSSDERHGPGTDRGAEDQVEPNAARRRDPGRPIAGTRLVREWRGVQHTVEIREHDFEYEGRPYKSLSAIARQITNVRWNGWVFFGLRPAGKRR
jgi:Protein of unknown function (DUF2924)